MRIEKIIDDITVHILPKLQPDETLILSSPNLFSDTQAEALKEVMNKLIPNNKWIFFISEDLSVKIEKEIK